MRILLHCLHVLAAPWLKCCQCDLSISVEQWLTAPVTECRGLLRREHRAAS